jgi:hypothetical protein
MEDEEVSAREARELDAAKQKVESTFQRIIERHASEATVQEEYPDELRKFLAAEAARLRRSGLRTFGSLALRSGTRRFPRSGAAGALTSSP